MGLQDRLQAQVLIALLAAACGKSSAERAECKAQVAQLDAFLHGIDRSGQFPDDMGVTPVHLPELARTTCDSGLLLFVHGDAIDVNGSPGDPAEAMERYRQRHPTAPPYVCIGVDGATPWKTVVAAVKVAGTPEVRFAFGRDDHAAAPAHTHVDDEVVKLHRATELAGYASKLVAPCPPMSKVFGHVGSEEGPNIGTYLIDHSAAAIGECECAVQPAEIASLMWELMHAQHPVGYFPLTIDPAALEIAAPADATWATVAAKLAPQMTRARLTIAP